MNNAAPALSYASHFGVYALILDRDKTHALMIKKALGCYTGLYDLPGGSLEPGELLEEALKREVLEETDCTLTRCRQLGTFSTLYPFRENNGEPKVLRHIGAIYLGEITGTPRAHANGNDDSDGCVWLPLSSLSRQNTVPLVMDAIEAYAKKA